jgi:hypothetical protein
LFCVSFLYHIYGQPTCDILTPGISANPNMVSVGQTTDLIFSVYNDAQGGSCCYETESVQVYVFLPGLPNAGIDFQSIISPAGGTGPFFNWVYSVADRTLIGTNHTPICDGEGEVNVTLRVIGTTLPFYPQFKQVGITIIQNPDGPPFLSNNEGNDNGVTVVQINAPLPIDLASFKALAEDCNQVQLIWQTASEINNDFVEIQRSEEGRNFIPVGKVKGTNSSNLTRYTFNDVDLKDGTMYFYRLRQVDLDGTQKIFDPVSVRTQTCRNQKFVSIYPNPVMDKLNVSFKGFESFETSKLVITNSIGEVVRIFDNVTLTDQKELDVTNLISGIYNLKLESANESFVYRFVKI